MELNIREAIGNMFPTWEELDAPQATIQEMFDGTFSVPPTPEAPTIDVAETDDEVQITANVVGFDPKYLWVNVDRGVLTIKGASQQGNALNTFTQQISIPEETTKEDVECEMEDGKLLITIQKN